jgi:formate hydrogenlyase subunit 6/NADH:ubiquinone oxidoreductase subunit I
MYYIEAEVCINCTYCEPVCPVNAIYDEFKMPGDQRPFLKKSRDFYKANPG